MSNSNLSAQSMSELKALALELNAVPTGDKRSKQSWIDAIELAQATEVVSEEVYTNHPEGLSDLCEIDEVEEVKPAIAPKPQKLTEIIKAEWSAPETVSDAEMEEIAHAADSALTQTADTVIEVLEPAEAVTKVLNCKSASESNSPFESAIESSEQTAPKQQRGASIIALIVFLAFGVAFLVTKTGLTAFAWVLTALSPLVLGLWRYRVPDPKHQDSIDYFPLPVG